MKNGKKPTKNQKIFIKEHGLNYDNWLVVKNTSQFMEIIHRTSGDTMKLYIGQVVTLKN